MITFRIHKKFAVPGAAPESLPREEECMRYTDCGMLDTRALDDPHVEIACDDMPELVRIFSERRGMRQEMRSHISDKPIEEHLGYFVGKSSDPFPETFLESPPPGDSTRIAYTEAFSRRDVTWYFSWIEGDNPSLARAIRYSALCEKYPFLTQE